jgi:hypothetical protein
MSTSETMMYEWDRIDWRKQERSVFKLQKRIYQASRRQDNTARRVGLDDNHQFAEEPDEGKLSRPVLKTSSGSDTRA